MPFNWERWARASGIAFVVFAVLAFIVGGETPQVGDSIEKVVSYYDGDRSTVLVSSFLFAVGLGFWIWFAGTLANNLRERGEGRVAATRPSPRSRRLFARVPANQIHKPRPTANRNDERRTVLRSPS